jgi:hypothetical protein
MAIARSDELSHSPAPRETKSSSRVIAIIVRSLYTIFQPESNDGDDQMGDVQDENATL